MVRGLIAFLLALSVLPLAWGADAPALKFGPLVFGAGLDAARKAAPGAEWRDAAVSPYSGRVFSIAADDAVEIGGLRFSAVVREEHYTSALHLDAMAPAANGLACEAAALAVAAEIEKVAGPLSGGEPMKTVAQQGALAWNVTRSAGGVINVTPQPGYGIPPRTIGEVVSFGVGSSALVTAADFKGRALRRSKFAAKDPFTLLVSTAGEAAGASISVRAEYESFGSPHCALKIDVSRTRAAPPPQRFDAGSRKILRTATIAERHFAAEKLGAALDAPYDAAFDCKVSRTTGGAFACARIGEPSATPEVERTARAFAEKTQFDMKGDDRDDPVPMATTIPVRISATDRKPIDFLAQPRMPATDFLFDVRPSAYDLERAFPSPALRKGVGARMTAVCAAQADGSLICAAAAADNVEIAADPALAAAFKQATYKVLSHFRVAPTLRDGRPSAGGVFAIPVDFRIGD